MRMMDGYRKNLTGKLILTLVLSLFLVFQFTQTASASWSTSNVYKALPNLTGDCIMDSITVNGKTVNAIYNYKKKMDPNFAYSSDTTYCCAALVTRFYREVYGISVYNLMSTSSVPKVLNGAGSFQSVSTPKVGDIIRINTSVHWAIVKSVNNGVASAIQQNAWYVWDKDPDNAYKKAWIVNAVNPAEVTFFRWTGTSGTLDVNGFLNGANNGGLGECGTVDVYINGSLVANDVGDYCTSHSSGTSYEIKDIKAKPGYEYLGVKSGSLQGTVSSGQTLDIRLSFSRMGSLKITGVLDDVEDSSINGYGTYDVFINGELDESGCTSYNKQWPRGTSYEIRNIQPNGGKSYTSLVSGTLSGNITSMTDLQVVLGFESDRIATPEWQTAKSLPGNLDPDMLDIEYKHVYTREGRTSPGDGWELVYEGSVQYENDGSAFTSDDPMQTSETLKLVGNYYYHYCNNSGDHNAAYYYKSYLPIRHEIGMDDAANNFNVEYYTVDNDPKGSRDAYRLVHKNGEWAGGYAMCSSTGTQVYYKGYVYQKKKAYQINTYQKEGDWVSEIDPSASSHIVRWRLKNGIAAEYKGLQLDFVVDGESRATLDGVAGLNIYIDGTLREVDTTSFRKYYPGSFSYEIQVNHTENNKLYQYVEGGDLTGVVDGDTDMKILTLYFETGVLPEADWKIIEAELVPYIDDETCEIEYRHTYIQQGRTSPGADWELIQEGAVQYENDGGTVNYDDPQETSSTLRLVGHYYYHYCNNGAGDHNAAYYYKSYLPTRHEIGMADAAANFRVEFFTVDHDTRGDRNAYRLVHLNGQYSGAYAMCSSTGTQVYYEGNVYQPMKPYRINTYRKITDWTAVPDPNANSVEYRIRKRVPGIQVVGNIDGQEVASLENIASFDVYLNGELIQESCTGFYGEFLEDDVYSISNICVLSPDHHYTGLMKGSLTGTVTDKMNKIVLSFTSRKIIKDAQLVLGETMDAKDHLDSGTDWTGASYQSMNPDVATVREDGTVTALRLGAAVIAAVSPNGTKDQFTVETLTNVTGIKVRIQGKDFENSDEIAVFSGLNRLPFSCSLTYANSYRPDFQVTLNFLTVEGVVPEVNITPTSISYDGRLAWGYPVAYQVVDGCEEVLFYGLTGNLIPCVNNRNGSRLELPSGLKVLEDEALSGTDADYVFLPDEIRSIGKNILPSGCTVFMNSDALLDIDPEAFPEQTTIIDSSSSYNLLFAQTCESYGWSYYYNGSVD